ncbi:MAG: hypothetical protein ACP5J8_01350, partial [Minisyncoccia bacterium]
IKKVYNENGNLICEVNVNAYKVINNSPDREISKKIFTIATTEYVLHDLSSKKDIPIKSTDLKENDQVAIWILENNKELFNLDHLTAIKIIKFK